MKIIKIKKTSDKIVKNFVIFETNVYRKKYARISFSAIFYKLCVNNNFDEKQLNNKNGNNL